MPTMPAVAAAQGVPERACATLLERLDDWAACFTDRYPDRLRCRPGCSDCCQRDLELVPLELDRLMRAAMHLPAQARARVLARARQAAADQDQACPLLEDERCLTYAARSVFCRIHGPPARIPIGQGRSELSLCPHNFAGAPGIAGEWVLDLEPVLCSLAELDHAYCAQRGRSPGPVRLSQALLSKLGSGRGV